MDTKAPVASPTFTGTATAPTVNASTALQIGGVAVTATAAELNTLDGITASVSDLNGVAGINSNVQTQLNLKAPLAGPTFTGTVTIGGATYPTSDGSAGQILTTNGSGAVSFADPAGGGGQFDAVASGAIANGALVSLNSDGTVSVTSGFVGTEVEIDGSTCDEFAAVYDTNSSKIVIIYLSSGNSSRPFGVVGTVSGTSISFGTPTQISTNNMTGYTATFDSNSNKVVAAFKDNSDDKIKAVVGTVSGTSISFGSLVQVHSGGTGYNNNHLTFDSNSNKVVLAYKLSDGGVKTRAKVGTVSGTSISFGSEAIVVNNTSEPVGITFDSSNNKVIVIVKDDGDGDDGKAIVGTVSSTSISFGTAVTYTTGNGSTARITFDSNVNKAVIIFLDTNASNILNAVVGTVSGTSISFGSTTTVFNNVFTAPSLIFDTNLNKVFAAYRDNNNKGLIASGEISGTSITFGTGVEFNDANLSGTSTAFDSDTNQILIAYRDEGNSAKGMARMAQPTGVDNFFKWIGFASSAISNSATGTINVLGGINESQTSLSVGQTYYLTDAAALSTTAVSGREVGKALSATKLLITQGSIS